jgi:uncharacterized protein YggE
MKAQTRTRWLAAAVAGALIGMSAVAVVAIVSRDDRTDTQASTPAPTPGVVARTITVSGEGSITVKPDTASISMGVMANADTATAALDQANKSAAALIDALKAAGVKNDDIVTSGLSIWPTYSNSNRITGYQASNNVTVTVRDISKSGPVIDAAAKAAGDNITIGGISFYVDDTEKVISTARANAIANAQKRAGEYAAAAGVKVGAVMQISEVSVSQPPVYWADGAGAARDESIAPTPVQIGTTEISVSVTVVFELTS